MTSLDPSRGPLAHLRVLDLTSGVSGPWCTKLLADYGADVIKVERPGTGDESRGHGAFPDGVPDREASALFLWLNTSKRGITCDITTASGRALVLQLASKCDAVVHDWRPSETARLRLSYADLAGTNEHIVVTSVTAFGDSGPYADWLQPNIVSFATGGQHYLTGDPDREPLQNAGYQALYQAGAQAFGATLAALWHAEETGEGQEVEVAGMEAQASILELYLADFAYRRSEALQKRRGNFASAAVGIYPAIDGHIGIHAMPKNWPQLLDAMDAQWMAEDERFVDNRARLRNDDGLLAHMYGWAAGVTKREAYDAGGRARAPIAPVNTVADLLASEHLQERGFFRTIEHPVAGTLTYPGAPARLPRTPTVSRRAPLLGEHNIEVYVGMLGLAPRELVVLRAADVV